MEVNKHRIIADAMELATTMTKNEYGERSQLKGLHYEYRQGAMDAIIKILQTIPVLTENDYLELRKKLGLSRLE